MRLLYSSFRYFEEFLARVRRRVYQDHIVNCAKGSGVNVKFEAPGVIHEVNRLEIGDHVRIGGNHFFRCKGGVKIGSHTRISRNVVIHTVNHNYEGSTLPYDRIDRCAPVEIGDFCWIGMNCCILPGVRIGAGAIVAMGTVVSKDVAPGDIVASSKQRVIGCRDNAHMASLVRDNMFLKD